MMSGPQSSVLGGRPQPPVMCSSSWQGQADLAAVVKLSAADFPAQEEEEEEKEEPSREHCAVLELPSSSQVDSPCTLSLLCAPQGKDRILSITVCSEARTIEVYGGSPDGHEEEYLGTSRGERYCTFPSSEEDGSAVLYKAHLKFEFPAPSCTVKLLSLGGRSRVLVSEISVQMTSVPERCSQASCLPELSINLDRVQSIMDSMGGKMSPGAEQLMNMVRAQQKHQVPFGAHFMQLFGSFQHGRGQMKEEARQPTLSVNTITDKKTEIPVSQSCPSVQHTSPENDMKSIMSSLLQNSMGPAASPDSLVPFLRNLCVGNKPESCIASKEEKTEPALERLLSAHMERMERTLMAHIDQRMRRLQEHLDTRLDRLLNLMQNNTLSKDSAEKLVNGQNEHRHQQDYDCGEFIIH
ncbi:ATPase PAAT [Hyla sarda]|uniref:ATPase PAAT n=1 Tax=Hyla sarda TaxID=327740 RepID=UPI0024C31FD3|nr:ATPase PAAT [Hyla sarda]